MNKLRLSDTITALRNELATAAELAEGADIQFPVGGVEIELHVGVTSSGGGKAGVSFWVVELGGDAGFKSETIQKVKVILQSPIGRDGAPVRVSRELRNKP